MSDFAARADAFLAEYFALHPLSATTAGMHDHDAEWPDAADAGRTRRVAFFDRWQAELSALRASDLTVDEQIDRDLLIGELEEHRFGETVLREDTWSPLLWEWRIR